MGVMPSNARKGHAHEGCGSYPLLLTRILLFQSKGRSRRGKRGKGGRGTLDLGKGDCPRGGGLLVLARAQRKPESAFYRGCAGSKVALWRVDC